MNYTTYQKAANIACKLSCLMSEKERRVFSIAEILEKATPAEIDFYFERMCYHVQ